MSWKNAVEAERTAVAPPASARRAEATVATCTCASMSPGSTKAPATSITRPLRAGRAPAPARQTTPRRNTIVASSVTVPVPGSSSRAPVSESGGASRRGEWPGSAAVRMSVVRAGAVRMPERRRARGPEPGEGSPACQTVCPMHAPPPRSVTAI